MKRKALSIPATLLLLMVLVLPASVSAADLSMTSSLLPVDIIIDQDNREIRKVYDLSPETDPSTLPMDAFERNGLWYECTDILRDVIIGSETQTISQDETVESSKNDMDTILTLLPQDKDVTTEDGFSGTLHLVLDSIKTEPSGYGSTTKEVTATRSYPNLASEDISHLPKTITDGGRTLTLQDVQWKTDNTYNADDYEIGDRFTAICTYGGSKKVSYVKGYTTTAKYVGDVYHTGVTVIRYTVIFDGNPIVQDAARQTTTVNAWLLIPIVLLAILIGAGMCFILQKRKTRSRYEEISDDGGGADSDDDGISSGSGSGV